MLRCRNRVDSYPSRRPTAGRAFSVTVKLAVSLAGIIALTRSWQLGLSILSQRGSEVIDTLLLLPHALHGARRSLPVEAGRATAAAGWRGKRRHSREVGAGSCAAPSKARTNQEVAGQPCEHAQSYARNYSGGGRQWAVLHQATRYFPLAQGRHPPRGGQTTRLVGPC